MDGTFLKKRITYKRIGNHNLFIVPDLPSWVVLTDEEAVLFRYLVDGSGRQETLSRGISHGLPANRISAIFDELLVKLAQRHFYPPPDILWRATDAARYERNIHLCLTHRCNLRCLHCYLDAGSPTNHELSLSEWREGFQRLFQVVSDPDITVSGGEPTLLPFLSDLLRFLHSSGARLTLYTNGTRDIGRALPYLRQIQVSLEGISSATHDYIRGKDVFSRVAEFIRSFPEKKKLIVAVTLMAHNFDEIRSGIQKFLVEMSLSNDQLRLNADLEPDGRAAALPSSFRNFLQDRAEEVFHFVHDLCPREPRLLLKNMRNCGIGISIGIDSNGDVYPCDVFENKQGNILISDLHVLMESLLKLNESTEVDCIEKCRTCDLKYICLGGCKAKNLHSNGSYCKPICGPESKTEKYYRLIFDVGV